MLASEIVSEIKSTVFDDDNDLTDVEILSRINIVMNQVAAANGILLPWLSAGESTLTTSTSAASVDMPSDYHKHMYHATDDGNKVQIPIVTSLKGVLDKYGYIDTGDNNGDVVICCVSAGKFVYQRVPSESADITIRYYEKPTPLTTSPDIAPPWDTSPFYYPGFDQILIDGACRYFFSRLEQDVEDGKGGTAYHKNEYLEGMQDLKQFCIDNGGINTFTNVVSASKTWV